MSLKQTTACRDVSSPSCSPSAHLVPVPANPVHKYTHAHAYTLVHGRHTQTPKPPTNTYPAHQFLNNSIIPPICPRKHTPLVVLKLIQAQMPIVSVFKTKHCEDASELCHLSCKATSSVTFSMVLLSGNQTGRITGILYRR